MYNGNAYFGTFSERLLASFVAEQVVSVDDASPMNIDGEDLEDDDQTLPSSDFASRALEYSAQGMLTFEDRVKQELEHIGVLPTPTLNPNIRLSGSNDDGSMFQTILNLLSRLD